LEISEPGLVPRAPFPPRGLGDWRFEIGNFRGFAGLGDRRFEIGNLRTRPRTSGTLSPKGARGSEIRDWKFQNPASYLGHPPPLRGLGDWRFEIGNFRGFAGLGNLRFKIGDFKT